MYVFVLHVGNYIQGEYKELDATTEDGQIITKYLQAVVF